MEQVDRELITNQLIQNEGLKLKVYPDSKGIPTIGIGRNVRDRGITKEEALYLLNNDIDSCERDLDNSLSWWRGLSQNRRLVLLDMCFNLGISRLLEFKNTLNLIRNGKYKLAAIAMLDSLWAKQVGQRAKTLSDMMKDG